MKNIISLIVIIFLFTSCALQQPPTGGKKDITPPKLLTSIPKNKSINYNGTKMTLVFDEYIEIDPTIKQQLLITPNIENYKYKAIKRGIEIEFEKPLLKNTTYTFNFRKTIKDLNEKNPAKNLKIVFSTGSNIDSLSISGKIKDLENNKDAVDILVGIYENSDTLDIIKHKPFYFTKTDSSGDYIIENMKSGTYKMYAITDGNNNLTYQERNEKIGFIENDSVIDLNNSINNINLYINKIDETPPKLSRKSSSEIYYLLEFNEGLKNIDINTYGKNIPFHFNDSKTIELYNIINDYDSIPIKIIAKDSSDNILEKEIKIKFNPLKKDKKGKEEIYNKRKFEVKIIPENGGKVINEINFQFDFNKPVITFDTSKLVILADTIKKIDIAENDYKWNIYKTQLIIKKKVNIRETIRLKADKGTFFSVEKDTIQKIKNDYKLKIEEEYGSISGNINISNDKKFIVQVLNKELKIINELQNVKKYKFSFLDPGEYIIRVIIDSNSNGVWDKAKLKERINAEKIIYYKGTIPLKQNFDMEGNDFHIK